VISFALTAAAARGTDLVAVHAWRHLFPGPAHVVLDPFVDGAAAQRREEGVLADALATTARGRAPGVGIRRVVERDRTATALVSAALAAQLLVVGHRHRATGMLGSTTAAVLHRAACPVAVVPLPARPVPASAVAASAGPTRRP
jgi:nucleotide-binding universal stress UspA family protein